MKNKIDGGGPAFPVLSYEYKASGDLHPSPTMQSGMSLRVHIAIQVLPAIINKSTDQDFRNKTPEELRAQCVRGALLFADALIAASKEA